jgi:hypothetical protein
MKNLLMIWIVSLMGCASTDVAPAAIIEGTVKISPLCGIVPVGLPGENLSANPCGLSNADLDKIYADYDVVIKNSANVVVSQKKLDHTGEFSFTLNDGTYLLNIESKNTAIFKFTQKSELEKTIVASKDKKQIISISINTGIR